MENKVEAWLDGPVAGIPAILQPVAHTLIQAKNEINAMLQQFPDNKLWEQPAGVASVGFHLQHIVGVLDRLFSYAHGKRLSNLQLKYLSEEGLRDDKIGLQHLLAALSSKIDSSVEELKTFDPARITEARGVGRKQLPSSVLGLLFHAAEHTMRHTGQMLVTTKVLAN